MRVGGLNPSITVVEVGRAVAKQSDCFLTEIKMGSIRWTSNSGTAWVRCPLRSANKLAQADQVRTSWFPLRVELLEARPFQCFKYFERGHV